MGRKLIARNEKSFILPPTEMLSKSSKELLALGKEVHKKGHVTWEKRNVYDLIGATEFSKTMISRGEDGAESYWATLLLLHKKGWFDRPL